jgi:O-antigen/teichoic acid export membrane protein
MPASTPKTSIGPAFRASAWSLGGYAAGQAIRFAGNLVLTRVLFPDVFGLAALVTVFIQGLVMFSDLGIGPAIIQSPRSNEPRFLDTAWTLQALRGVALWLAACAIAWPVSYLYHQPMLGWLLPVAGFNAVIYGTESVSVALAKRQLTIGRLTLIELTTQTLNIGTTVLLTFVYRGVRGQLDLGAVWAVVAGHLVATTARSVLTHTVLPRRRHRFALERDALRALFRFGRWVFLSTVLTFLAGQSDRLIFAREVTLEQLGVYGVAAALAMLPTLALQRLGASVLFPAYSRVARAHHFAEVCRRGRLPLLLCGAGMVSVLVATAPHLIGILFDDRYAQAGWMLRFLAAAAWFQILESTNSAVLMAQGRTSWHAADNAVKFAAIAAFLPLGFALGGFPGALAGLVAADVARYLSSSIGVATGGLRGWPQDLPLTALLALTSALGAFVGATTRSATGSDLVAVTAAAVVAGSGWAWFVLWRYRGKLAERLGRGSAAGA